MSQNVIRLIIGAMKLNFDFLYQTTIAHIKVTHKRMKLVMVAIMA